MALDLAFVILGLLGITLFVLGIRRIWHWKMLSGGIQGISGALLISLALLIASLAANLHLAACTPAVRAIEYPPSLAAVWDTFGKGHALGPSAIIDGCLPVPDGPGLGAA